MISSMIYLDRSSMPSKNQREYTFKYYLCDDQSEHNLFQVETEFNIKIQTKLKAIWKKLFFYYKVAFNAVNITI